MLNLLIFKQPYLVLMNENKFVRIIIVRLLCIGSQNLIQKLVLVVHRFTVRIL